MRTLRGRPRNISESGIVYLDSEGEDSEFSDSDVEPVFFPAAEFELGEALEEFAGQNADDDDDDLDGFHFDNAGQDANANRGRFFQLIHQALDTDDDDEDDNSSNSSSDIHAARNNNLGHAGSPVLVEVGGPEVHSIGVIQYFGGTVQVRHIVHENFTQLQHQQHHQQGQSSSSHELEGGQRNSDRQGEEEDSEGEPPSICESEIVIRVQVDDQSVDVPRRMTEQHSDEQVAAVLDETLATLHGESEEGIANSSSEPASGLVPYPDLPDYASAGEEDEEEFLKASIPAPYKSLTEAESSKSARASLKRKEPDSEEEEEESSSKVTEKTSRKRIMDSSEGRLSDLEAEGGREEEETCNPMASEEEESEEEEAFRGDRIGNTVYSERHVLKILMRWIEELPNYSVEKLLKARENGEADEEETEKKIQRLETEFEEQMSLLWDMSSETDVMRFLVENKIFSFVRDTIEQSASNRLTEIALGVLANVISEPSIIEDFTVHDSSLQLVEKVVELSTKVSDVAVLIQVFSVLRRIVWYLRNVSPVKKWTNLLQSPSFLGCSNFIMSSSRNALLLGNVMILFFMLLDFLCPDSDDEDRDTEESVEGDPKDPEKVAEANLASSARSRHQLTQSYEPFCQSEFVPAICEALKELMKNPKPSNSQTKLFSAREKPGPSSECATDDRCPNADDVDIPIPEGHVQQSILKGISTLALLQKATNGQESLKRNADKVVNVLLDFHRTFTECTEAVSRSNCLEYFALSLHLLSFCHTHLESVNQDAIVRPIATASKLMSQEEKDKEVDMVIRVQLKDGVEFDSVSYIALVAHEYLAAVAERFGPDSALKARSSKAHDKFFTVLDQVLEHFNDNENTGGSSNKNGAEKSVLA